MDDSVRWSLEVSRGAGSSRAKLAQALEEIRAKTETLSNARFEKLVAEAGAYARKRR